MISPLTCIPYILRCSTLVLVLALFPQEALSDGNSLTHLCCSAHPGGAVNEFHGGLFYGRDMGDTWGVIGGTYRNSQDRQSLLLGLRGEVSLSEGWDLFVVGGYVTGYERNWGGIPGLEFGDTLQLYVVPGVVYALGFRVPF